MKALVSIIITTYGGKDSIVNAVASCLNQSYDSIEVIVVDDSGIGTVAQRKTEKLLKHYIDENIIKYVPHIKNLNASAARNTGFSVSSGEYIALLDDDDEFVNDKILNQVSAFESLPKDYGVVYSSLEDVVDNKIIEYRANSDGNVLYDFLMMKVAVCTSNMMVRRELYQELNGFDPSFMRHQDWEFIARLAEISKFYGVKEIGTIKHTQNITKRYSAIKAEEFRNYYIQFIETSIKGLSISQKRKVLAHEYNELAKLFLREKNLKKVLFYLIKSRKPGAFAYAVIRKPFKTIWEKTAMKMTGRIVLNR